MLGSIARRGRRWGRGSARPCAWCPFALPHEHFAVFVYRHFLDVDQFKLQVFERVGVEGKVPLQNPVGQPALLLQQLPYLSQYREDIHHWAPANSSNSALASCKSLVS